jgi:DNA ligase (NAD+)
MNVNEIVKKIIEADNLYYNNTPQPFPLVGGGEGLGKPMTDQEYDGLKALLKQQEPDHPLFAKIGDTVKSDLWEKATHQILMGSLDKVNTEEEFRVWASKYNEIYVLEPKMDGLSLSLDYEKGFFKRAITRGDGTIGEDISANVRKMKNFQNKLNKVYDHEYSGSFRCEIIMPIEYFDKINSVLSESDRYENCRNAASGISRRLDGRFSQYLQLFFYDVDSVGDEETKIKFIRSLGLETVVYSIGDVEYIIKAYQQLKNFREKLPYKIDGSVIKINSWDKQQEAGERNGRPKGQIAWKFDPPGSATILESVSFEVGRTGVVTPLGHVQPVVIDGSTIKNVTLHNIAEIERLGVGIGDLVMVCKMNDVIPKIISVIEHKGVEIKIPTVCPRCGSLLENDGIRLFCRSTTCPAKNHYRIMNWIKVVGIDNLGESTVDELEKCHAIDSIKDIYKLNVETISAITGGEKSAEKILTNINKTRTLPLQKFLAGIGIPTLSVKTAEDLVVNCKNIKDILSVTVEDLNKIKGYSDISSSAIVGGLKSFKDEILELLTVIKLEMVQEGGKLSGIAICFTGNMSQPRPIYQEIVRKNGGKCDSTVTKTTTYLVCNENKGSSKSMKAEKLGVKIINESEFLQLIGQSEFIAGKDCNRVITTEGENKIKNYSLFEEE